MRIKVECYSGYRGEETPRRLLVGEKPIEVVDVLDRWLAPDHRYFKCLGADDATYIVRNDASFRNDTPPSNIATFSLLSSAGIAEKPLS